MNTGTRRTEFAKQSTVALALWVSIYYEPLKSDSFVSFVLRLNVPINNFQSCPDCLSQQGGSWLPTPNL